MKSIFYSFLLLTLCGVSAAFVSALPSNAHADTIRYVKAGRIGDGASWANASGTLQAMIDAVEGAGGGEVWVAAGTYTPTTEVDGTGSRYLAFQMKHNVAIYGGFLDTGSPTWPDRNWESFQTTCSGEIGNPDTTTDNCYHVFYNKQNLDADDILDGFTINGGNANGNGAHNEGGGMYNERHSSPSVVNCTFSRNSAREGGGMFNDTSDSLISNCTFLENFAELGGAGIFNVYSSIVVKDCTFIRNSGGTGGGGMENESSMTVITGCTFSNNTGGMGGGISNDTYCMISDCVFTDNIADHGGGIFNALNTSPAIVTNCKFHSNKAINEGGAMYTAWNSSTLSNCVFFSNTAEQRGGAIINSHDSSRLTNCAFYLNYAEEGAVIFNYYSNPMIVNSILWGDTSGTAVKSLNEIKGGTTTVSYCDISVNPGSPLYPGIGNISLDPMFVNSGSGDFRLLPYSPCIDTGTNSVANLPKEDFEGDPRILNSRVDMGVDEWSIWFYDRNMNRVMSYGEMVSALKDYLIGNVPYARMIDVLMEYLVGPS